MRLSLAFLFAVIVAAFGFSANAQAQVYVVCNNSTVNTAVCIHTNCGGIVGTLAPCPALIAPGQCFTWVVPTGCIVTGVRVNTAFYPTPAVLPFCYNVAMPPPTQVCFSGGGGVVQVVIQ